MNIKHFIYLIGFSALLLSCKGSSKEHLFTNALIDETSPYLLQHAHNPVDWRPWSETVWEDAKAADKLVIISVGYSSCHWCHVMEKETFEDEEVAKLMNEKFISVKVDREERPDVDQVYMTATQLLTGSGGWPLNVIALPDGKPLYGGTYHTKTQWVEILTEVVTMYEEDPANAYSFGDRVAQGIQSVNYVEKPVEETPFNKAQLEGSVEQWKDNWDFEWGGQKTDQKFMMPGNLMFLLHYADLTGDEDAKNFVKTTLDKMLMGGLMDQLGGGFYRYSTDTYWKVPHFEKMLYDNAQALSLYAAGYKVFKDPAYKEVIERTAIFLDRDLSNQQGAYYAALDADSEGEEGKYYTWTSEDLQSLVTDKYEAFASYYGIHPNAAWEEGKYILYREISNDEFGKANSLDLIELKEIKRSWHAALMEARSKRVAPGLDDKIITSWNALLISGYVDAYEATGNKDYITKAEGIYEFLATYNKDADGLLHTYKDGGKRIAGFLEDYALMAKACLNLYSATGSQQYLEEARAFQQVAESRFADEASGMYRYSEGNELIATVVKTNDDVMPSPNAVMAENKLILGHIDYDTEALDKSKSMLTMILDRTTQSPDSYSYWNAVLLRMLYPYFEIAIVGEEAKAKAQELENRFLPNALIIHTDSESKEPLFDSRYVEGETLIYVCQNHTCKLPVKTTEEALEQLENW
ncbi:MAG: thioredoxin domain-containing protein [Flavobacteriaceae bacterium]|nr:thioredoxin domain-containing protein [Flavobacteriaceae bacterium]MDH3796093.1 thioredoxin domain-containing protein [Flavobacteriaceae bacterium]